MAQTENEIQDEVVLMQQFRTGSEEAFTTVYRHLHQRVYWFARKFVEETEKSSQCLPVSATGCFNIRKCCGGISGVDFVKTETVYLYTAKDFIFSSYGR